MNWCVPLLLALALPAAAGAQDTEWNRYTLEGLPGVYVTAEADAACEQVGLSASEIQANAATALLEAEVPLLSEQEMLANVGLPELYIALECAAGAGNGTSGTVAYSVSVRMQQAVKMVRDEQVTLSEAVTWYATDVGVAPAAGAASAIEEALTTTLDEFATAFIEANAEEGGGR